MHETEKVERKKNLKKKMSLQNCSNHLLFLRLFSQTLLFWIEEKLLVLVPPCHWILFLRKELQILYEGTK
jgi:hypothetical protein